MAIKKFPHAVIYKGELYPANTEIEFEEEEEEVVVEDKAAAEDKEEKVVTKNEKRASRKA